MRANQEDIVAAEAANTEPNLMNRLKMKPGKIAQLAEGARQIAAMEEPIARPLSKMEIAKDLILEQVTAPLGVLLIIFESRPDALPQIASSPFEAATDSSSRVARRRRARTPSSTASSSTVSLLRVARDAIVLVEGREGVADCLKLNDVVDLVIPRGSNDLVSYIQNNTKIPVLGHADGVCHMLVDEDADLDMACKLAVDSKTDYPAACNALETLLVHASHVKSGAWEGKIKPALKSAGVELFGGRRAERELGLAPCPALRHEYGSFACTVEVVASLDEAIDYIHANGSAHTDCIITKNDTTAKEFLREWTRRACFTTPALGSRTASAWDSARRLASAPAASTREGRWAWRDSSPPGGSSGARASTWRRTRR